MHLLKTLLIFPLTLVGVLFATDPSEQSHTNEPDLHQEESFAPPIKKNTLHYANTNHGSFPILQKKFKNGNEVTQACIQCHTNANSEVRANIHWTWSSNSNPDYGKGQYSINNYCISTNKMKDTSCTDCHIGWNGKQEEINCLACHSQKSMNWKEAFTDIQGFEADGDTDSLEIAKEIRAKLTPSITAIGKPGIENCGDCHFKGGGGDGTKHGDLDTSLINAPRQVDVHLSPDGGDFSCVRCHTTQHHAIAGRSYEKPASTHQESLIDNDQASKISCMSCHTDHPHAESRLNEHSGFIACQTCHIPSLAPIHATKVAWDWSTAGKLKDGKPYVEYGPYHQKAYMSIKGSFVWEKNVIPNYLWYNGSFEQLTIKDKIDPSHQVNINHPNGEPFKNGARIAPFKLHTNKQPYDTEYNTILAPRLSFPDGFWKTLDWNNAIEMGQKDLGLPYSGNYSFVNTNYYISSTHMVRPKEMALSCTECHHKDGRLKDVPGVYIPGCSPLTTLDRWGRYLLILSLTGISCHGALRFRFFKLKK
jgi:octaheme c-type cytochrome (tetrathionate reductase family)